jgi:8-oxo-dGTP pyrophosphatase MutT (NUDIX family)
MNNLNNEAKILMTLQDKDIFSIPLNTNNIIWKDRPTCKIVLFNNEGNIALIGNKVNDYYLLPGGGIDDSESLHDAVKRECREETGCEIIIEDGLGITEDYRARDSKHSVTYGFIAKVTTQHEPTLTESEIDIGAYVRWISLQEAINIFLIQEKNVKAGEVKFYNTCFNIVRDLFFLQQAKKIRTRS